MKIQDYYINSYPVTRDTRRLTLVTTEILKLNNVQRFIRNFYQWTECSSPFAHRFTTKCFSFLKFSCKRMAVKNPKQCHEYSSRPQFGLQLQSSWCSILAGEKAHTTKFWDICIFFTSYICEFLFLEIVSEKNKKAKLQEHDILRQRITIITSAVH